MAAQLGQDKVVGENVESVIHPLSKRQGGEARSVLDIQRVCVHQVWNERVTEALGSIDRARRALLEEQGTAVFRSSCAGAVTVAPRHPGQVETGCPVVSAKKRRSLKERRRLQT